MAGMSGQEPLGLAVGARRVGPRPVGLEHQFGAGREALGPVALAVEHLADRDAQTSVATPTPQEGFGAQRLFIGEPLTAAPTRR
jgi:hypothetical protein